MTGEIKISTYHHQYQAQFIELDTDDSTIRVWITNYFIRATRFTDYS